MRQKLAPVPFEGRVKLIDKPSTALGVSFVNFKSARGSDLGVGDQRQEQSNQEQDSYYYYSESDTERRVSSVEI